MHQNLFSFLALGGLLLAFFNGLAPSAVATPALAHVSLVVVIGVICAQVGTVAIWGVFSSAHFARRLQVSAAIGLAFYGCFSLGILAVDEGSEGWTAILLGLAACPLVLFAVQAPLWAARIWLQCEIAESCQPPRGSYLCPNRISDLILGTAAISVALAIARVAPGAIPEEDPATVLIFYAVMSGIAAVASLTIVTPLIFVTLGARHTAAVVIGVAVWFGGIVAILATIVGIASGALSLRALNACLLGAGSFATVICTGLLLVRGGGYRLRWRRLG